MLDRLEGQPRCVCSNSSMTRLKISLERTRLWDRFAPHIYSAVEVGDLAAEAGAQRLSLRHRRSSAPIRATPWCWRIRSFGVAAAKAAGARVIGFTGGAHTWPSHADLLTDAGAETVINRLVDLPATAEALLAWEGMTGLAMNLRHRHRSPEFTTPTSIRFMFLPY